MNDAPSRALGAALGAPIVGGLIFALWKLGHPYSAFFLLGAVFQHLCAYVYASLGVGPLRFTDARIAQDQAPKGSR